MCVCVCVPVGVSSALFGSVDVCVPFCGRYCDRSPCASKNDPSRLLACLALCIYRCIVCDCIGLEAQAFADTIQLLSHTHTYSLTLTYLTLTHTHTPSHLTHSHTHTLSLSFSLPIFLLSCVLHFLVDGAAVHASGGVGHQAVLLHRECPPCTHCAEACDSNGSCPTL